MLQALFSAFFIWRTMPSSSARGIVPVGDPGAFNYQVNSPNLTTSAGVYDSTGTLMKTLWSAVTQPAGVYTGTWNGTNDQGLQVSGTRPYHVRVLSHNVQYVWEGVIGNLSSSFTGSAVMSALLPTQGLSISGSNLWVSVSYNERQQCIAQFALSAVNTRAGGMLLDSSIAPNQIATDASNLYWATTGGFSSKRFVAVNKLSDGSNVPLSSGTLTNGYSAIDIYDHSIDSLVSPTGISVSGSYIAVAHGGHGLINFYNVTTGAFVSTFNVASMAYVISGGNAYTANQITFDPSGNLWVVSGTSVVEYTTPAVTPTVGTTIAGFSNVLAIAADSSGNIWIADGGTAQQVFEYSSAGSLLATFGTAGGYATSPAVTSSKLMFYWPDGSGNQTTDIAPDASGGVWVIDTGNLRIQHFTSSAVNDHTMQWWNALYSINVDHLNPNRVFLNYCEFNVDYTQSLTAGPSQTAWTMTNNWLAGNPSNLNSYGFSAVETLSNGRTYATISLTSPGGAIQLYELPASGVLRSSAVIESMWPSPATRSEKTINEDGSLTYVTVLAGIQTFYRQAVTGFDGSNNPVWGAAVTLGSVPTSATTPYWRNAINANRFPITSSNIVIAFDQTVATGASGNEGYHLGGVANGGSSYSWLTSHTGALNGKGAFQTHAIDGTINYGGNLVWSYSRHVFYGFHGEFFTDLTYSQVGQANQFMHYYDDGLFIGQFGVENITHFNPGRPAGCAGNSFSPTYAFANNTLYWYHNDESVHGGMHRWRVDGINTISEQDIPIGF
jgi:hypothetical protein